MTFAVVVDLSVLFFIGCFCSVFLYRVVILLCCVDYLFFLRSVVFCVLDFVLYIVLFHVAYPIERSSLPLLFLFLLWSCRVFCCHLMACVCLVVYFMLYRGCVLLSRCCLVVDLLYLFLCFVFFYSSSYHISLLSFHTLCLSVLTASDILLTGFLISSLPPLGFHRASI